LYCTVLYCTILYCVLLYCTLFYSTLVYCTALYFIYPNVLIIFSPFQFLFLKLHRIHKIVYVQIILFSYKYILRNTVYIYVIWVSKLLRKIKYRLEQKCEWNYYYVFLNPLHVLCTVPVQLSLHRPGTAVLSPSRYSCPCTVPVQLSFHRPGTAVLATQFWALATFTVCFCVLNFWPYRNNTRTDWYSLILKYIYIYIYIYTQYCNNKIYSLHYNNFVLRRLHRINKKIGKIFYSIWPKYVEEITQPWYSTICD
jgi:hypothetical protein